MEQKTKKPEKFTHSITFKAFVVGFLTLIMLIPGFMIQGLIDERQSRSYETIAQISEKWSRAQTLCGPILSIPYDVKTVNEKGAIVIEQNILNITPENLDIKVDLEPEERYQGIFKAILYKSVVNINGTFGELDLQSIENHDVHLDKAYVSMGVSDLRGISQNIDFKFNENVYNGSSGYSSSGSIGKRLVIDLSKEDFRDTLKSNNFSCSMNLKGSGSLNFIPIGRSTQVEVEGAWGSPGFVGNFSPEHTITPDSFNAKWGILHFNRDIPAMWTNSLPEVVEAYSDYNEYGVARNAFYESSFGVDLIDPVDHYQQNMRSAKYSFMFIALTFVVFFFVEILTRKRIHPIQYLLVGVALILFYSLLLSISEQINFSIAYLIASIATVSLITIYSHGIFKNITQTGILSFLLCTLYTFLYVILQQEETALLIGSVGLFVILGLIMFVSRKITWYKQDENEEEVIKTLTTETDKKINNSGGVVSGNPTNYWTEER